MKNMAFYSAVWVWVADENIILVLRNLFLGVVNQVWSICYMMLLMNKLLFNMTGKMFLYFEPSELQEATTIVFSYFFFGLVKHPEISKHKILNANFCNFYFYYFFFVENFFFFYLSFFSVISKYSFYFTIIVN